MARILLVDDDMEVLYSTKKILELAEYEVAEAMDGQAALDLMRAQPFDLVITDVRMPKLSGLDFLKAHMAIFPGVPVVLMTAFGTVEDAVWAMKFGAVDFLTKPFKRQTLLHAVEMALKRSFANQNYSNESSNHLLIGQSAQIKKLREEISQVAMSTATVLILGESGTGKELVATSIHQQSPRVNRELIRLNCAAVSENLIESELFGHEKGAFTGAYTEKKGLFEAADGGTLFLDEIGDMPLALQAKLLRTLQEGEIRKVGSAVSKKVDVRVIAATNRNLKEDVKVGRFRQDLLFRLEVIEIATPALRERLDDVPVLAKYFLKKFSQVHQKQIHGFSPDAVECLRSYTWPGNVRELSNVIERAIVFCRSEIIEVKDLPAHISIIAKEAVAHPAAGSIELPVGISLKEAEDILIRKTLEATSGDKNMTATLLGINSRTIYRKLDKKP
jgi:two-component system, NtrC family, response regulator HydG